MLTKNLIKFIQQLHLKKGRQEHGLFIAEGAKIVPELLASGLKVKFVAGTEEWVKNNRKHTDKCEEVFTVDHSTLGKISGLTTPNEALAVVYIPDQQLDVTSLYSKLSLVLDEVKDPGNLGTIMRIADWYGIENIICSEHTVDAYNPKAVQASMNSIARVHLHYLNLEIFLKETANHLPVYGTLLEGENIYQQKLCNKGLIILGNESVGISEKLLPYIRHMIRIPHVETGSAGKEIDSLNVAVAAAVVCSEFRRNNFA